MLPTPKLVVSCRYIIPSRIWQLRCICCGVYNLHPRIRCVLPNEDSGDGTQGVSTLSMLSDLLLSFGASAPSPFTLDPVDASQFVSTWQGDYTGTMKVGSSSACALISSNQTAVNCLDFCTKSMTVTASTTSTIAPSQPYAIVFKSTVPGTPPASCSCKEPTSQYDGFGYYSGSTPFKGLTLSSVSTLKVSANKGVITQAIGLGSDDCITNTWTRTSTSNSASGLVPAVLAFASIFMI
ncbi:hypothetical protein EDD86DRAFT_205394 [Gorgonomyces haynaldii]|nr:hypothetical protein EDD86DRAFT_205394 [Gorgonomyces haynaldii]